MTPKLVKLIAVLRPHQCLEEMKKHHLWDDPIYLTKHYKTEPCKRFLSKARCDYSQCPYYHGKKERRRPFGPYLYTSEACELVKVGEEWKDVSLCNLKDNCPKCHTRMEQQFHPEVYKKMKCKDMQTVPCPRGVFCAFAHMDAEVQGKRRPDWNFDWPKILPSGTHPSYNNCSNRKGGPSYNGRLVAALLEDLLPVKAKGIKEEKKEPVVTCASVSSGSKAQTEKETVKKKSSLDCSPSDKVQLKISFRDILANVKPKDDDESKTKVAEPEGTDSDPDFQWTEIPVRTKSFSEHNDKRARERLVSASSSQDMKSKQTDKAEKPKAIVKVPKHQPENVEKVILVTCAAPLPEKLTVSFRDILAKPKRRISEPQAIVPEMASFAKVEASKPDVLKPHLPCRSRTASYADIVSCDGSSECTDLKVDPGDLEQNREIHEGTQGRDETSQERRDEHQTPLRESPNPNSKENSIEEVDFNPNAVNTSLSFSYLFSNSEDNTIQESQDGCFLSSCSFPVEAIGLVPLEDYSFNYIIGDNAFETVINCFTNGVPYTLGPFIDM